MRMHDHEPLLLLDIRGLLLRMYWSCDKTEDTDDPTEKCPSWTDALARFLELDFLPQLDAYSPRRIVAVWDAGNEYRTSLFPHYKKARKERKKDAHIETQLKELFSKTERLMAYLGVKNVRVPGQEADDVIALFCERMKPRYKMIRTVDADLIQLVTAEGGETHVALPEELFTPGSNYKGIPVELIRLHKSMVGDQSDGYGGVPKFGDVAWSTMLSSYGVDGMQQLEECVSTANFSMLEQALAATNDPKLELLNKNRAEWIKCYNLAKLAPEICYGSRRSSPLKPVWNVRIPNAEKVREVFMEVGAPDLYARIEYLLPRFTLIDATNTKVLQEMVGRAVSSPIIAYDYESHDPNQYENLKLAAKGQGGGFVDVLSQRLTGMSMCFGDNCQETFYISTNHAETPNLTMAWIEWALKSVESGTAGRPIAHNAAFELAVTKTNLGIEVVSPYDSSITASYVDENESSSLKHQSKHVFNYDQITYSEVTKGRGMNEISGEEVLQYGCDDSLVTAFLFDLHRMIMQLEGSWDFYVENEVEHVQDQVDIFIKGTDIDLEEMARLEAEDRKLIADKTAAIRKALEANAMNKSLERRTENAQNLLNILWEFESAKLKSEGKGDTEVAAAYQKLWEKCWANSTYVPYSEQEERVEFVPTPTVISKVLSLLGVDIKVEKTTKKYIGDWLGENDDLEDHDNPKVGEFLHRLAAAADYLQPKKRNGPKYEALAECGQAILDEFEPPKNILKHGTELNFGSPPQMTDFLYGILGLPLRVRSKMLQGSVRDKLGLKGAPATGKKPVAAAIVFDMPEDDLDWRKQVLLDYNAIVAARQNISLYYTPYPLWVYPTDGRIHPQIRNCGTVTRRPSGTSPNALQVSKKDGAKIRRTYVAKGEDKVYVCLDFAGQELRITASESGDKNMIDAYVGEDRKDLHSLTASSFAHIFLSRAGLDTRAVNYETYLAMLASSDPQQAKVCKDVRNLAKACIVEGSPVLTHRGLVPIEEVQLDDLLWDGLEWVSHDGVVFKGHKEVIEHDGLLATPDHEVYLQDGRKIQLWEAASEPTRPRLAVGAVATTPVRYDASEAGSGGRNRPESGSVLQEAGRRSPVYDIVNAGPRHRFTVSGKVVSNCNFLIIYGGGYTTLAQNLLISQDLAKQMMENTFSLYSGLEPWQKQVCEFARKHGYVETAFGNRRHVTRDIYSDDGWKRSRMERQAVNATIQGCAADILKVVLTQMRQRDMVGRYHLEALKPVYDEVAAVVPKAAAVEYIAEMKEIMEITPPGHPVPMEIDVAIGLNSWGDKQEIGSTDPAAIAEFLRGEG